VPSVNPLFIKVESPFATCSLENKGVGWKSLEGVAIIVLLSGKLREHALRESEF
jgi:hypothetical protein